MHLHPLPHTPPRRRWKANTVTALLILAAVLVGGYLTTARPTGPTRTGLDILTVKEN